MAATMAERLREAREAQGLSARALDARAGITVGHTALIESGQRVSPAMETVRKLAVALGVSLDWLVTARATESGEHPAVDVAGTGTD